MAHRLSTSLDIGSFCLLTESYCLVGEGPYPDLKPELERALRGTQVVQFQVGGLDTVGIMAVGNSQGLLLPNCTSDYELEEIESKLGPKIKVQRIEESFNALGNVIVCNDQVALVHPQLSNLTKQAIRETLGVPSFEFSFEKCELVGQGIVLTNKGAILQPLTTLEEFQKLQQIVQLPLISSTVGGSLNTAQGILANSQTVLCCKCSTDKEVGLLAKIVNWKRKKEERSLLDELI